MISGGGGGGGGGNYFSGSTPPEVMSQQVRELESRTTDEKYEVEVAGFLNDELATYNTRDANGVQKILDKVKSDLKDEIGGTVDLRFGGSVAKHTYVDGLSDVDALVLLDPQDIKRRSPERLRELLGEILVNRFGKKNVKVGDMAATLTLGDKTIQLLPAIKEGAALKVSNPAGRGWASVNPKTFARALTNANKAMDGKLVPTIKLAKAIIAKFSEPNRLTGYHTEALAIEVFKGYRGEKTTKNMLRHFFENASGRVTRPIKDKSGQSDFVDEYLGAKNSVQRRSAGHELARVARKLKNAEGAKSIELWRDALEGG